MENIFKFMYGVSYSYFTIKAKIISWIFFSLFLIFILRTVEGLLGSRPIISCPCHKSH